MVTTGGCILTQAVIITHLVTRSLHIVTVTSEGPEPNSTTAMEGSSSPAELEPPRPEGPDGMLLYVKLLALNDFSSDNRERIHSPPGFLSRGAKNNSTAVSAPSCSKCVAAKCPRPSACLCGPESKCGCTRGNGCDSRKRNPLPPQETRARSRNSAATSSK